VLALGVRFDDRVAGNVDLFIRGGRIIHIDIDRDELGKNKTVTLPICADLAGALEQLVEATQAARHDPWIAYLDDLRTRFPFGFPDGRAISPQRAIRMLRDATDGQAIVSLGVGQHQMWAMQHYRSRVTRSFLSSSGFGTMGYGLPAAVARMLADPAQPYLLDVIVDAEANVYPMIPAGGSYEDIIMSDDDLARTSRGAQRANI